MECFDNPIYEEDELEMNAKRAKQIMKLSSNKTAIITVNILINTRNELVDEKNAKLAPPIKSNKKLVDCVDLVHTHSNHSPIYYKVSQSHKSVQNFILGVKRKH